jgi:sulfatase maturation enzyme AslB (radical SAM superfamily)
MTDSIYLPYIFDLELTNLCNTACAFCPRDAISRPQGHMTGETFDLFLERLISYSRQIEGQKIEIVEEKQEALLESGERSPVRVIFCGMGECLIHKHAADWLGRIRSETGLRASIVTNGALLSRETVDRLISAGVTNIFISVPGINQETYNCYIPLEWNKILTNICEAHRASPGVVRISATLPADASISEADVRRFWQEKGIPVESVSKCHNRGGFLTDQNLLSRIGAPDSYCGVIVRHNFIAWDGQILSCCHDLKGNNLIGSIQEDSFLEIARRRTLIMKQGVNFEICKMCNDPERFKRIGVLRTI